MAFFCSSFADFNSLFIFDLTSNSDFSISSDPYSYHYIFLLLLLLLLLLARLLFVDFLFRWMSSASFSRFLYFSHPLVFGFFFFFCYFFSFILLFFPPISFLLYRSYINRAVFPPKSERCHSLYLPAVRCISSLRLAASCLFCHLPLKIMYIVYSSVY